MYQLEEPHHHSPQLHHPIHHHLGSTVHQENILSIYDNVLVGKTNKYGEKLLFLLLVYLYRIVSAAGLVHDISLSLF
jgi:hypothetical protein